MIVKFTHEYVVIEFVNSENEFLLLAPGNISGKYQWEVGSGFIQGSSKKRPPNFLAKLAIKLLFNADQDILTRLRK